MTRPLAALILLTLFITTIAGLYLFKSFQATPEIPTKTVAVCGSESFQLIVNGGVHKVSKDVSICK